MLTTSETPAGARQVRVFRDAIIGAVEGCRTETNSPSSMKRIVDPGLGDGKDQVHQDQVHQG
jgi:hypothetical protein